MAEYVVRPVRKGDAELLAATMRAEDAEEVRASHGNAPLAAIAQSLAMSKLTAAVEIHGELAALVGVVHGPSETLLGATDYDVVWVLTAQVVMRYPLAYVRVSKKVVAALLARFPLLACMMDARYTAAVRWAKTLKGEVFPAVPWGVEQRPFHPIVWRA